MLEFIQSLLLAVLTAAVLVLATHGVSLLKKVAENAATGVENAKKQGFIMEIAGAVSDAVAATSQTYVDGLKKAGTFTEEAQAEAAQKALTACLAAISPPAKAFAESAYGDLTAYLANKIEAEVRKQKGEAATALPLVGEPFTAEPIKVPEATAVTATVATVVQKTIPQTPAISVPVSLQEGRTAPAI